MKKNKSIKKRVKKNKYNIILVILGIILLIFSFSFVGKFIGNYSLRDFDDEIIIIRDQANKQESFSLKEIRNMKTTTTNVRLNNGLENIKITGISLEKFLQDLGYEVNNSPNLFIEDSKGSISTFPTSIALEVDRVILTFKINDKPNKEYDMSMGVISLIDSQSDSKSSWINDVKVISID
ncbi:hypothetical protein [Anaerococcus sp. AGMB09787]|uniref:hypothetical protein n=1 Tax=Anaerococcus sp. AGMB09787 TaxID=2922869 RepID=UPI001FAE9C4B|nr:hypothetical protein [Anaerococcus sp. AGMB09787]